MSNHTAASLTQMLRERHSGGEWVFVEQVPDGTGMNKCRTADAIAMGVWAKTEFMLHGFEVKVSRSDWQKELNDLQKSRPFEQVCHYWWIVAPKGVVNADEVPANWGWLWPGQSRLNVGSRPILNESAALNYNFFAGLLRRVVRSVESIDESRITAAERSGYARGLADGKRISERSLKPSDDSELRRTIEVFESASGVKIGNRWDAGRIGDAVKIVMSMPKPKAIDHRFETTMNSLSLLVDLLKERSEQARQLSEVWPSEKSESPLDSE